MKTCSILILCVLVVVCILVYDDVNAAFLLGSFVLAFADDQKGQLARALEHTMEILGLGHLLSGAGYSLALAIDNVGSSLAVDFINAGIGASIIVFVPPLLYDSRMNIEAPLGFGQHVPVPMLLNANVLVPRLECRRSSILIDRFRVDLGVYHEWGLWVRLTAT
jgi:hypothetical protein